MTKWQSYRLKSTFSYEVAACFQHSVKTSFRLLSQEKEKESNFLLWELMCKNNTKETADLGKQNKGHLESCELFSFITSFKRW